MNNFIVSALKYRPTTFDTVVGQQSITKTLKNAIKTNHLAHAYLFFGPRGVGKTTCARIFAKTINCENLTDEQEACNVCESCISFNESRSFNIHELDAASNNSVDNIRNLTEQVRIPPQVGKYSIYIIDEVHMLSTQAFNAFLKTLEEPPKHAIFILATTEKHKIIPTILSRCQIFDFNRIKIDDTIEHLQNVASKENIVAEIEALNIIAQKSDGAMRDALSIFDQIVSSSGNNITYSAVIENLNVLDYDYFFKLTDYFLEGNIWQALIVFDEILNKGFDAHNFINSLSKHFRDLMICKDPQAIQLIELGPSIRKQYSNQAGKVSLKFLLKALETVNNTDLKFKESKNKRLHIEISLISLCNIIPDKLIMKEPKEIGSQENQEKVEQTQTIQTSEKKSHQNIATEKTYEKPVKENNEKPSIKKISSIKSITQTFEKKVTEKEKTETQNSNIEETAVSYQSNTLDEKFSLEKLIELWTHFAENYIISKPRLFNILNSNKPQLKDNFLISLNLNNHSQESSVNSIKPELMKYLSFELKNNKLKLEINVLSKIESNHRPYTNTEKMKYLANKNPMLKSFTDELSLDFQ